MARFRSNIVFIFFILLGVYLINHGLSLIPLPEYLVELQGIIFTVSGILLIFGGFKFLKLRNRRR